MPSFPNASRGIKNVYRAEILDLISILAVVVGTILVVCSIATGSIGGILVLSTLGILIMIGSLVLAIISFVKMLTGLRAAGMDDALFQKALICVIVSFGVQVVAVILSSVVKNSTIGNDIATIISRIADLAGTYFILTECSNLLEQRLKTQLADKGSNTRNMIVGLFGVSILFRIIPIFTTAVVVDVIFLIIYAVISIIAYVKYLSFLKNAYVNFE